MSRMFDRIANRLEQLPRSEREPFLRRIESIVIGRPLWRLVSRIRSRQLELLLPPEDLSPVADQISKVERRGIRAREVRARDRVTFGRKVDFGMRRAATNLRNGGESASAVRDLVYGRIIKRGGMTGISTGRYWLLIVLGIIWHMLAAVICALLLILTWALPGSFLVKLPFSILVVGFFFFCISHINAISVRPALAARRNSTTTRVSF